MKIGDTDYFEFVVHPTGSDWAVRLTWLETKAEYKTVALAYTEEAAQEIAQALNEKHGY